MESNLNAVERVYFDLLDAWNRRDAESFASLFAPDGGLIGFDGSTVAGQSEIERHLSPIFADHPTARYVAIVREIREIAPGVALLKANAGMTPPGKDQVMPDRNCVQLLIASGRDGAGWRIDMFQNTPAAFHGRPEETRRLTEELQAEFDRQKEGALAS